MIITRDDKKEISRLRKRLATKFKMKNLRGLKYFLGIEVARSRKGIFLSQMIYVLDLLSKVGLLDYKPIDTLIVQNHKLGEYLDQVPTNKERYQRLVGNLIYLSHTHPNIAYAISIVNQFMHSSSRNHMDVVVSFFYRKSTSGYFTFVRGNLVTWRSKKQKVAALSTADVKLREIAKGLCELLQLKRLLTKIGFVANFEMNLFCDNKETINMSHNLIQHDCTKHIEVDRHFIQQNLEAKIIQFSFVKSKDQLAIILTKVVSNKIFYNSLDKLGISDIYAPT